MPNSLRHSILELVKPDSIGTNKKSFMTKDLDSVIDFNGSAQTNGVLNPLRDLTVKNILVDQLNIHKIIIGYDHRFGENRSANITDLIHFGKQFNFEVEQINAEEINEITVSSTKIRTALLEGAIELANQYLGYDYFFSGTVMKGKQLGRTIGFPTANIKLSETNKLIPKNGVYIIYSTLNNKRIYGMMNIGHNPTVGENNKTIEVHYFDVNEDLYYKIITVAFLKFIRTEEKFDTIDALKIQLNKDREFSKNYINDLVHIS
jgi:riboflavin kinase/FMN adenylyltransferase